MVAAGFSGDERQRCRCSPAKRARRVRSCRTSFCWAISIFDNAAYVGGGPDVITQLREKLPAGWRATLGAVDGSTMPDINGQLDNLPVDATHLVVSIGGNDALGQVRNPGSRLALRLPTRS